MNIYLRFIYSPYKIDIYSKICTKKILENHHPLFVTRMNNSFRIIAASHAIQRSIDNAVVLSLLNDVISMGYNHRSYEQGPILLIFCSVAFTTPTNTDCKRQRCMVWVFVAVKTAITIWRIADTIRIISKIHQGGNRAK